MWQRFTERARRVVFFSQEEAARLGEMYVSTEHLLLGLVRENDSVAARILDTMGIPLEKIRNELERQVTRGDGRLVQDMQLTPRAKRVVDLAYDEARQLNNNYIGTEHLLLGLIREGEGLAGRVLAKLGVELVRTRQEVKSLQDAGPNFRERESSPPSTPASPVDNLTKRALKYYLEQKQANEEKSKEITQSVSAIFDKDSSWRGKALVSLNDVSAQEFNHVLNAAEFLKHLHTEKKVAAFWDYPRILGMIFEKPSLRTRVSFEAGMVQLGGHAIYLAPGDIGLGTREPVADVAAALSRWVNVISARVFRHETVEELAANATVPVINALSDREHPIQTFADLLTLQEQKGELGNNLKIAYIGDGNNVLHALLLACAKMGVHLSAACPEGYFPDEGYVTEAKRIGHETGAQIAVVTDTAEAAANADVLYTDVWASMGQEEEKAVRAQVFAPYQINAELMTKAKPDAIVLHCLPAHCGEEIAADVFEKHKTVIMDQAENRMHTQKALIALMIGI